MAKLFSIGVSTRARRPLHVPHYPNLATLALVLATGSKWSGPIDLPDSKADLYQFVVTMA